MSKNVMLLWILLGIFSLANGEEKYLHISTNPSHADVYIGKVKPDHAKEPDFKLPDFIPVKNDSSILISLFKPEFADTTIRVHLPEKDTSFLIVALRPLEDEELIDEQWSELSHRTRKKIGRGLLWASIAPIIAGGISAGIAEYYIHKANDEKKILDASLIRETDAFKQHEEKFFEQKDHAKTSRSVSKITFSLGGIIFCIGAVLSF